MQSWFLYLKTRLLYDERRCERLEKSLLCAEDEGWFSAWTLVLVLNS